MKTWKKIVNLTIAVTMTACLFAPITAHAEEKETGYGTLSYNNPEDKDFLDELDDMFDLTNPDNQWIATKEELLAIIEESNYYATCIAVSPKYNTSIFVEYYPFPYNSYCCNYETGFWVPAGMKFETKKMELWEVEESGSFHVKYENEVHRRRGFVTYLVNENGEIIENFTEGTNYIVTYMPILYNEEGKGVALHSVLPVLVYDYKKALETYRFREGSDYEFLTEEEVNYYVALSNLSEEEQEEHYKLLKQQYEAKKNQQ